MNESAPEPAAAPQAGDTVAHYRILERLGRHEMTADEAATAIRSLGRTDR